MLNRREFVAKSVALLSLIPFVPHFNLVKEKDVRQRGVGIKTITSMQGSLDLSRVKIFALRSPKPFGNAPDDTEENFGYADVIALVYEPGREFWWNSYEKDYAYRIWTRGVDMYNNDEDYDGGYSFATGILE